jgi:aminoglycoside 3-N-acetyltransferase
MTEFEAQKRITEDLLVSGLRRSGAVLVHPSLSSMGYVPGGAETVILGLLDALGPDGTLLLPALSYEQVLRTRVFDVLHTPSNVGAIPEYFRTRPGTIRSVNPTHSVCGIGAQAEIYLKNHYLDETPCGENSPYRILRNRGGQILFLGCGLKPNTSMHSVEELIEPPYLFGSKITYHIILPDGKEAKMNCQSHNFAGWRQRYDRICPLLKDKGLKIGKVLAATTYIIEAPLMFERALIAMKQDPFYFVERSNGGIP